MKLNRSSRRFSNVGRVGVVLGLVGPVFVLSATNAQPASALSIGSIPLSPASITTAVVEGAGSVSAFLAAEAGSAAVLTTTAEVATAAGVGLSAPVTVPAAVVAGAALATGGAVYIGWKWATGHDNGYADPPPAPAYAALGSWLYDSSCVATSVTCTYVASGTVNGSLGGATTFAPTSSAETGVVRVHAEWTNSTWSQGTYDALGLNLGYFYDASQGGYGSPSAQCSTVGAKFTCDLTLNNRPRGAGSYLQLIDNYGNSRLARNLGTPPPVQTSSGNTAAGSTTVTTTPTSQCSGGSSVPGTPITYTGATSSASLPVLRLPACPSGQTRTGFTTPSTGAGGAAVPAPLSWTAPTVPSGFPECNVLGQTCTLNLLRIGVGGDVHSCLDGGCVDWQTQTQRTGAKVSVKTLTASATGISPTYGAGDIITEQPRTYPDGSVLKCTWGPYVIPVDECVAFPVNPKPTNPKKGGDDSLCDWKLTKPWTWPYTALICAFVPEPGSLDQTATDLKNAWTNTPPALVGGMVTDLFAPFLAAPSTTTASDCSGPAYSFSIPTQGSVTLHPFSTCPDLIAWILSVALPIETFIVGASALVIGSRVLLHTIGAEAPV